MGNSEVSKVHRTFDTKDDFLRLIREIIQCDHGDHFIQAGAVLALYEAIEAYIIRLLEDMNLCAIHTKCITILPCDMRLARRIWGKTSNKCITVSLYCFISITLSQSI